MTADRKDSARRPQPTRLYRTAEVLRATGISRQVLYRYITLGFITPAEVTETGRRMFDESVFSRLDLVRELNQSGYTLREIRETFFRRH